MVKYNFHRYLSVHSGVPHPQPIILPLVPSPFWGHPSDLSQDGVSPYNRTAEGVFATRQAVCLFHSCGGTALLLLNWYIWTIDAELYQLKIRFRCKQAAYSLHMLNSYCHYYFFITLHQFCRKAVVRSISRKYSYKMSKYLSFSEISQNWQRCYDKFTKEQ